MKVYLFGGFGEKGRVCIGVCAGATKILVDIGVRTEGGDACRYPVVSPQFLQQTDAIVVTHAHDDHIGAAGNAVKRGFGGAFYMTSETLEEARQALKTFTCPSELAAFTKAPSRIMVPGRAFGIGDLTIETGRSGHTVGGVWVAVGDGKRKIVHCGDVIPRSPVLAMDPLPLCDVLLIDASYGGDRVAFAERSARIRAWVKKSGICVLPTPATGRSLELLAALGGGIAIHAGLRRGLEEQLRAQDWFHPGVAEKLRQVLELCTDWTEDMPWPKSALLIDDSVGLAGPSKRLIPRAVQDNIPLLGTGYLSEGSPLAQVRDAGRADWLRFPTHPTLPENVELVRAASPKLVVAHSCPHSEMAELDEALPGLNASLKTGDGFDV